MRWNSWDTAGYILLDHKRNEGILGKLTADTVEISTA